MPEERRIEKSHSDIGLSLTPTQVNKSIQKLKQGISAKLCTMKNKPKVETFKLNEYETHISWTSTQGSIALFAKKSTSTVCLDDIVDIQRGYKSEVFQKDLKQKNVKPDESLSSFSLILKDQKTIDISLKDKTQYEEFISGIAYIVRESNLLGDMDPLKILIMKQWMKADKNMDGKLDFKEISALALSLNIHVASKVLKKKFEEYDIDKSKTLEYHEFCQFYKDLLKKDECEELFQNSKSTSNSLLEEKEFVNFMNKIQFEQEFKLEDAKNIMKNQKTVETKSGFCFTEPDFQRFLFSDENSAFNPKVRSMYQDMSRPISEYWISSSHNTYLEGNQLTGTSSIAIYKKVLLMGCRCVELDCWDSTNNEPIITHGHTLTSKIKFTDVIDCIKENAFKVSEYPVILSIENHCSEEQQKVMAKYMIDTFGDMLWFGNFDEFPSPNELKKKILIKNKRLPKDGNNIIEDDEDEDDDEEIKEEEEEEEEKQIEDLTIGSATSLTKKSVDAKVITKTKEKKKSLAKELSDITVFDGRKFKTFDQKEEVYQMHSLKEGKVIKLFKKDYDSFCEYTKKQFIRVYPKGTRINSSNYDPFPGFSCGCQLVALNFQTMDLPLRLNQLKFKENGSTGYILKPKCLLEKGKSNLSKITHILTLKILSAEQLPRPKNEEKGDVIDPYVKVTLFDGTDQEIQSFKTKTIRDNGFHPVWQESFKFNVNSIDLTSIHIIVYDSNYTVSDSILGENLIPLYALKFGYRSVELFDEFQQNRLEFGKLLIYSQLEKQ